MRGRDGSVELVVDGAVATVVLDRPARRNAISSAMVDELVGHLDRVDEDPAVRVVVLAGAGGRAFSAGFDLREMADLDKEEHRELAGRRSALWARMAAPPKPVVACLNGPAHGAGAILALDADIRIGCPSTTLRFHGVHYGAPSATWNLPLLVGTARATDLLLTAREIGAEEALAIGLLTRLVPDDRVRDEAQLVAAQIADHPPEAVAALRRLLRDHPGRSLPERYSAEAALQPVPSAGGIREAFASFLDR